MRLYSTFILLLIFTLQNLQAQSSSEFKNGDFIVGGIGCSRGFSEDYRFKPKDINSYQYIAKEYGKDKFQVYYRGSPLPLIEANKTVEIYAKVKDSSNSWYRYNNLFLTDGVFTYYDNTLMKNADTKAIYYVDDDRIPLFITNKNIYYEGYLLEKLNSEKTIIIDAHPNEKINFFTDGEFVYQNEVWIENADAKSFKRGGYVAKNNMNSEDVANSHDNKNYYLNGKKIKLYPNWNETKLFPDSIYNSQYIVTFISEYEIQDLKAKPAIDFYLSPKDFERLTKNKILRRKTELNLETQPHLNEVKGYKINIYKNKSLENTYYYEEELEEFDSKYYTQINVIGDGFHFSKNDFDLIREKGKPIKYLEEEFEDFKTWEKKIAQLKNEKNVIYIDLTSYYYSPINKEGKRFERGIYDYWMDDNETKRSELSKYEGLFTFQIERKKASALMGKDISNFGYRERQFKKQEFIEALLGKGDFFIHINQDYKYSKDVEFITFEIYCSKDFMKQVPKEYIMNEWQIIRHMINWQEKYKG